MKKEIKRITKRMAAFGLATAMAFTMSPLVKSEAAAKKPVITPKKVTLTVGKTKKLTIKKNGLKIKKVTWKSSKKAVATVSKKGVVKAKKKGTATIKAKVVTASKTYNISRKVTVKAKKAPEEIKIGEWVKEDSPVVQEGVKNAFDKYNASVDGVSYTPVATIAHYLGEDGSISWRVFARQTLVTNPTAPSIYAIVVITESMEGDVDITGLYLTTQEAFANSSDGIDGGWTECATPQLDVDEMAAFNKNIDGLVGVTYSPIAKIGTQIVNGTKYCILAEYQLITSAATEGYCLIDMTIGADGVTIGDVLNIDMGQNDEATGRNSWKYLREGATDVELQQVLVRHVGNGWFNVACIFANNSDQDYELDLKKFEFVTSDGSKNKLVQSSVTLKKNTSYIWWAFSLSKDFNEKLKVGEKVKVFFDGEELGDVEVEDAASRSWYYRGGWQTVDSPEVDNSLKAIVEKANTGFLGTTYTPLALLATREDDGQDFRIFCRSTPILPGSKTTYAIIEVHSTLLGEAMISDVICDTDIEAYGTDPTVGWAEAETPVIAKGEGAYFDKAVEGFTGVSYKAVALLGKEKIRGTKYSFICEGTATVPNAVPSYYLVQVNVNEEGVVSLGDIKDLANA
ncbi:MAG: Ig-like domain-containing protein [Eubacterium sp.]|nr:Ig-like domain-containing protein [Eubacterium sp.]